jgi:formylglycine-generating enzyme required for sulfatase activity
LLWNYTSLTRLKKRIYKLSVAAAVIGLAMTVASCQPLQQPAAKIQSLVNPAAAGARLPHLVSLPGGGILMSWVELLANGHTLKFSVFRGGRWVRQGEVARGSG